MKTRIKICGLTREQDVLAAVAAGADAIGFVFYPPSPRFVTPARAAELVRLLPPFVSAVGLFVNASAAEVERTLATVPLHVLQFHGDEEENYCRRFARPYLKAARVQAGVTTKEDLLQYAASFPTAQAILLDAFVEGYGGGGKTFDWNLVPEGLSLPLILSGGLDADNVGEAVRRVRPAAVDVSSGVEAEKGIKDTAKIDAFVAAVVAAEVGK
jgi:phosphoribosylanthranilate isomerase